MGKRKSNNRQKSNNQKGHDPFLSEASTQNRNRQKGEWERNNCRENSDTDLNVPGQQNHNSIQNMEVNSFGDLPHKYDDRPRSQLGTQQNVSDQRTTFSHNYTSRTAHNHQCTIRDTQHEYHDSLKDDSVFPWSGKQNHKHHNHRNGNSETQQNDKQVYDNNQGYVCPDNFKGNKSLQDKRQFQGSYNYGRHSIKHYPNQDFHHYQNVNQERKPKAGHSQRFHEEDHKLRNLNCGHSSCSFCVAGSMQNCSIHCPQCNKGTEIVKRVEDLSIDFSPLDVHSNYSFNSAMAVSNLPSGGKLQAVSREAMNASASSEPKEKSPHYSNCLKAGVIVNAHCAKCDKWVCTECGRIDHSSNDCALVPYKESLSQMIQVKESVVENAHQNLKMSLSETKDFCDKLVTMSVTMETALDCIRKEQKQLEKMLEDSVQVEAHLQATVADMSTAKTLSETLSVFKMIDETVNDTLQWTSSLRSSHMNDRLKKLSKELLFTIVQTHSASTRMQINGVLAMHNVSNSELFSKLVYEGSRIYVSALMQIAPPSWSHALPLESIKCCIDSASALTFLELSCGGSHLGRVYIRLSGDTLRGRQFLTLCMGEEGPSFRNTHFHRIWWRGLPGEHVWLGDYDQGDGSGGTQTKNCIGNGISIEAGRKLPITAGLVAGRYEKKDVSSIFRIFTRDAKDVVEEAAFGQVESGLQYLEIAIKHNDIHDVIISDCGIVIEF